MNAGQPPTSPQQFPPITDEVSPFAHQQGPQRALPPGQHGNGEPIPVATGPTYEQQVEARMRDLERRLGALGANPRAGATAMTRQAFELHAVLAYIAHESFPMPHNSIGDVLLVAQMMTDTLQKRGFFENTPEFRQVPLRVTKQGQGPDQQQGAYAQGPYQQGPYQGGGQQGQYGNGPYPQGGNQVVGDHPQGGDHRVSVSYPALR